MAPRNGATDRGQLPSIAATRDAVEPRWSSLLRAESTTFESLGSGAPIPFAPFGSERKC